MLYTELTMLYYVIFFTKIKKHVNSLNNLKKRYYTIKIYF